MPSDCYVSYWNITILKSLKYILPLLFPILIVVVVNETARPHLQGYHNSKYDVYGMNPAAADKAHCTWKCFFDTGYCKRHHVKYLSNHFQSIDPIYFGIINALHATGNYAAGNILFLVILWPALMYVLLLKVINLKIQLRDR